MTLVDSVPAPSTPHPEAVTVTGTSEASSRGGAAAARERRGRWWLLVSFIFCPCHLPVSMGVLGVVFGGSAMGAVIARNTLAVGIVFGAVYAAFLAIGFRHLRAATRDVNCDDGTCVVPEPPASPSKRT